MRRLSAVACAVVLAAGLAMAAPPASAADLGVPVGTGPQVAVRQPAPGAITEIRVGRHPGYDRVVFGVRGALPGWDVRYVGGTGGAVLRVALTGVTASASSRVAQTPQLPALRTVTYAGRTSTRTTFTLGLSDRLDFRVFALSNPTRVVVDLAQPITGPFTQEFATTWGTLGGDFTIAAIRTSRHPGYDRVVFDLPGAALQPNVGAGYAASNDPVEGYSPTTVMVRFWTFRFAERPQMSAVATYRGPRSITVGLPGLRALTVVQRDASTIDVLAATRARHGMRAFALHSPTLTRFVVDVAH
jgi:hypothetical protein